MYETQLQAGSTVTHFFGMVEEKISALEQRGYVQVPQSQATVKITIPYIIKKVGEQFVYQEIANQDSIPTEAGVPRIEFFLAKKQS